jgi:hypothetical protein
LLIVTPRAIRWHRSGFVVVLALHREHRARSGRTTSGLEPYPLHPTKLDAHEIGALLQSAGLATQRELDRVG